MKAFDRYDFERRDGRTTICDPEVELLLSKRAGHKHGSPIDILLHGSPQIDWVCGESVVGKVPSGHVNEGGGMQMRYNEPHVPRTRL